jgi:hypothetical protein
MVEMMYLIDSIYDKRKGTVYDLSIDGVGVYSRRLPLREDLT